MPVPIHLTIVYEQDEDGWWVAQVPEIRGVVSQGRTPDESWAKVLDALALAFTVRRESCGTGQSGAFTETLPLAL